LFSTATASVKAESGNAFLTLLWSDGKLLSNTLHLPDQWLTVLPQIP
jgi:hypothetical protein